MTCRSASACWMPKTINATAVQHFEELVNVVPNLNWSGDGHRARYFQIRGVGELEQYQGAPNPSVGFLIDDIDFQRYRHCCDAVRRAVRRGLAWSAG